MTTTETKPVPSRPYSRLRNRPERSVTEILSLKAIPGLPWAAANATAEHAAYSTEWRTLNADDAYNALRRHHRGIWDSKAALGTACHRVLESWFAGDTVDILKLITDMSLNETGAKSWQGQERETVERITPYLDALEAWWNDWAPEGGMSEECVRTPGWYVGTRDLWNVRIDGRTWGLDLKSGAGIYETDWSQQLAAYRFAEQTVVYGWDEKGKLAELSTGPNEPVDECAVVHLTPEGTYNFVEVNADEDALEAFMHLARLNKWLRANEKSEPKMVVRS